MNCPVFVVVLATFDQRMEVVLGYHPRLESHILVELCNPLELGVDLLQAEDQPFKWTPS